MTSEQFGVSSRVLRFFSVYGPGQQANGGSGVVTIFLKAALANQPLLIQSAGQRDFSDVSDVARGIGLALDLAPDGMHRVFNVATGIGTTFRQLADLIVELTGSRSTIQEQLAEPPGQDLVADISRARAELGYVPHLGLRDGLERYVHCLGQAV
jgi:nucleoside-diphosphate-sugar epimerase